MSRIGLANSEAVMFYLPPVMMGNVICTLTKYLFF